MSLIKDLKKKIQDPKTLLSELPELEGYNTNSVIPEYRHHLGEVYISEHRGYSNEITKSADELFGKPILIMKSIKDFEDGLIRQHLRFSIDLSAEEKNVLKHYGFTVAANIYVNRVDIEKIIGAVKRSLIERLYKIAPEKIVTPDQSQSRIHSVAYQDFSTHIVNSENAKVKVKHQNKKNKIEQANQAINKAEMKKRGGVMSVIIAILKCIPILGRVIQ